MGVYEMAADHKKPAINFKEVKKDSITFIEVTVTGRIKASKKNVDDLSWIVSNLTTTNIEVGVIDFYAQSTLEGKPSGGGSPFANGKVPDKLIVPAGQSLPTTIIVANGDDETIYKYSIVARVSVPDPNPNVWFLVKDPELEMDL
jgi:hypothetical protein